LLALCDIAALVNGPIEFFKEECNIENPYFLYDPIYDREYHTYKEAAKASPETFVYLGVE
jgi:hypothetical protein